MPLMLRVNPLLTESWQIWQEACPGALLRRNFMQPFMDSIRLLCWYQLAGKARMDVFNFPLRWRLSTRG